MEEKEKLEGVPTVQENTREITEEEKKQVIAFLKVRRRETYLD